jgi:hypothetical protein
MKKQIVSVAALLAAKTIGDNSLPETLTVNGTQVPANEIPELNGVIENIRKNAERKLYNQIDQKDLAIKNLQTQLSTLNTELGTLKSLVSTGQGPQNPASHQQSQQQPTPKWDTTDGLTKEKIQAQLDHLNNLTEKFFSPDFLHATMAKAFTETALPALSKSIDEKIHLGISKLEEQYSAMQKETVEEYKTKRLSEMKGKLIDELVTGSTKAEVEESIQKAADAFAKYAPAAQNNPPLPPEGATTPTNVEPPSRTPLVALDGKDKLNLLEKVKTMDMTEYAKHRDQMMREAGMTENNSFFSKP